MSSPAPLLRPPIPGSRQNGGARIPRLGLAIPPSPSAKPVNGSAQPGGLKLQMPGQMGSRPSLPRLQLATPLGSSQTPYEKPPTSLQNGRPSIQTNYNQSASGGSESSAAHSRSGSFGPLDGRASGPTSAGSQYSALSFASQYGLRQPQGTPDPASAVGSLYSERSDGGVGMERDGSMTGLEGFDKLSLERGRTLDVEELDDDGWRIASMEKRIEELSSLGEGAGGAVTKCVLKGGKTIFALKVRAYSLNLQLDTNSPTRLSLRIQIQMSRNKSSENWASIKTAPVSIFADTTAPSLSPRPPPSLSPWNSAKEDH